MIVIDTSKFTKDINFPITRAIYKVAPKRNVFQQVFRFLFTYKRFFEVMENYVIWVPLLEAWVFVPKRLIYDGASVPKLLHSLFNPSGMLLLGSLPHDFGYTYGSLIIVDGETGIFTLTPFSKKELDEIFENLCAWESEDPNACAAAKHALTVGGIPAWNKNRKTNRKLYIDFPELYTEIELSELSVNV